ncbi:MAG: hypothetical protein WBP86_12180 [Thiobacillaceae bacterium]
MLETDEFASRSKTEIANLDAGTLPLDQGVTQSGYVDDMDLTITVLHATEDIASIRAKVGVFLPKSSSVAVAATNPCRRMRIVKCRSASTRRLLKPHSPRSHSD